MKVLIASGASGGHIFPALSLLDELKSRRQEVLLVLPSRSRENKLPLARQEVAYISTAKLELRTAPKMIKSAMGLIRGTWQSLLILLKFKPDAVIGFGSLDSLATVLLAWLLRIKTLVHEQNVLPGKTNRLLARLADRVAISFEETRNYLGLPEAKVVFSGNPLRKALTRLRREDALAYFGFSAEGFNILIMGGSQGSLRINQLLPQALGILPQKARVQLIHIAGRTELKSLQEAYAAAGIRARVFDFLEEMQFAYSCADLAVCRSGALTISELIFYGLPAILIPYPFADGHQLKNAQVLSGRQAAEIIDERSLSPQMLAGRIGALLADRQRLEKMRLAWPGNPAQAPAKILADLLLERH